MNYIVTISYGPGLPTQFVCHSVEELEELLSNIECEGVEKLTVTKV